MSADPVRIGVVGVGSLGFHHARILRDLAGTLMAGIHDTDAGRAARVATELGVRDHNALEALLDASDAVVVAVPTSAHEAVALAALERGLHVLVEKPMAPTLEAADRILFAARARGAIVQIGHVERFNAAVLAAEAYLDGPRFVESHRMAPFSPRSTDVAVVLDLMIHDVDLVMSLVGRPVAEIAAAGVAVLTPNVDIANARLAFAGGAVANLTASRVSVEKMRKVRLFQPSGYLSLNLAEGRGEFLRLREPLPADAMAEAASATGLAGIVEAIPLRGEPVEPLRRELESFRDAALGVAEPAVSGQAGRDALAVTLSIERRIEDNVIDTRPA